MAYSNDPICAQKVKSFQKTLTAAKATLSGVTNATLLYTAPAEGAWVTRLWARPLGTLATATRVDIYISPDGSAAQLVDTELVAATGTISATTDIPETQFDKWSGAADGDKLYLGPSEQLWAGLSAAFATGMVVAGNVEEFTDAV